ncbi:MAG TPA: ABC transporter substrate-binding protein [Caldilineaceae bacterium]|nr:ABC transporter substrate-binding protein [Caldilineaceae bacterium]
MAHCIHQQLQRICLLVVSLVIMSTVVACTGAPPAASNQPAEEAAATASTATLRVGWPGSPDTLNPGTGILVEAYTIYDLVYDTLYDLQFDGSYALGIADSVDVSADGTVYTFHIPDGILFHDGTPLTANDVAFSLNLYKAHEDFPYLNFYTLSFESIEAPDANTVILTLSEAIPNLESQLLALYILPEHIWSQYAEGNAAAEFENLEMIGSGPFKMQEYQQNEFVHLVANKEHYRTPPKIDEVIFQTFGNEDALVQALQTGQVDMITEMPNTAVPVLNRAEEIALVTGAPLSPSVRDVIFNQLEPGNCPTDDGGICTGHPALRDRNVRLALAHATDKQNIIDITMLGLAEPGLTLVAPGQAYWYNDQIEDYAFDITLANQILDDAGYLDTDGDGIREMPDGSQPLTFRLQWANDIPEAPRVAELLGQTWSQIGVKTEPQAVDPDALTSLCCPGFDFDVMIWGWSWGPDPNDPLGVMRTDQIPTGSSETGYANPDFDALYDQQAVELDPEKRRAIVFQMQQMVFDDVVYIIPYYQYEVQAYRKDRFTGWITDEPTLDLSNHKNLVVIEPVQ